MKKIALLTSGGDAPGMNAAIRAITRKAIHEGFSVYGIERGFEGIINSEIRPLHARDVGGIITTGGTSWCRGSDAAGSIYDNHSLYHR